MKYNSRLWKYSLSLIVLASQAGDAFAQNAVEFESGFLKGFGQRVNLSRFAYGNPVEPGIRQVRILLNDQYAGDATVHFQEQSSGQVTPCISHAQLEAYGADPRHLAERTPAVMETCIDWDDNPWQARWYFDPLKQQLKFSIPHKYIISRPRDWVDPASWDHGINAAYIDYSYDYSKVDSDYQDGHRQFLRLNSGINLGPWRFRNRSTYNDPVSGKSEFKSQETYVQRDITRLRGQLSMGDIPVSDDFFQSYSIRGVQLESDNQMLPSSHQDYAPIIRGTAQTDAVVEIHQNGYLIESRRVAPGPFEFRDIYTSGVGADLEVVIKEADGSERRYRQPYAVVPKLIREGVWRYRLSAGEYREYGGDLTPFVAQGVLGRGFNHGLSLYSGFTTTSFYNSYLLGIAKDLGVWGAVSVDAQHARTDVPDSVFTRSENLRGESYRFLYAKRFQPTSTDLRMTGYRYSTKDYRTLQEAVYLDDGRQIYSTEKQRLEVILSQSLGSMSFSLSAAQQSYWQQSGKERMYQASLSGYWKDLSWSLYYTMNDNQRNYYGSRDNRKDESISLSLSIPLGRSPRMTSYLTSGYTYNNNRADSFYTGINGTALEDGRMTYSVQGRHDGSYKGQSSQNSGSASMTYQGRAGQLSAGYSDSSNYKTLDLGVRGAVLLHKDGVTLGQRIYDGATLVHMPGVENAKVGHYAGVTTDSRGYAIVSSISPYRKNRIAVDGNTLGKDVLVEEGHREVVPRRGAIVKADFTSRQGRTAIFMLKTSDGSEIPLGSGVFDSDNRELGLVDEKGRVYLAAIPPKGQLTVRWNSAKQCQIDYDLSDKDTGISAISQNCVIK